jgi:Bacterial Ig-like domain/Domain of unknown function (DUF6531)/Galactose oxidase, central domain
MKKSQSLQHAILSTCRRFLTRVRWDVSTIFTVMMLPLLLAGASDEPSRALGVPAPLSEAAGQSASLQVDGNWLLSGGVGAFEVAKIYRPHSGQLQSLPGGIRHPRAWHSTTLLPTGEALLWGGLDPRNRLVSNLELFNPKTQEFAVLPTSGPTARAGHTATLSIDGRILIAGGVKQDGKPSERIEIWNVATGSIDVLPLTLLSPRYQHQAYLLNDGTVLLWGGKDAAGKVLANGERINPITRQRTVAAKLPNDALATSVAPAIVASLPQMGAIDVATDVRIGLQFDRPMNVSTVKPSTLTLTGPQGVVATKVVAAEGGMLAFVTPLAPLVPATSYELLINAPMDTHGHPLTGSPIRFTTGKINSAPSSRSGQQIQSGNGAGALINGIAKQTTAQTSAQASSSVATPIAQARFDLPKSIRARKGVTAISGVVYTLDGKPLRNVTLKIDEGGLWMTKTDATGRFLLKGMPAGHQELWIDARAASTKAKTYGIFVVGVDVIKGKTTVLPYISWMPEIDTQTEVTIASPTIRDVVLTNPKIPGMEVHIPAGTIIKDHAGKAVTTLSLTPIPVTQTPFPLPTAFSAPIYFTVQPGGAYLYKVDGSPALARVIYPNYTQGNAGKVIEFWQYDPEGEGWHPYGNGKVTADAKQVVPDPGVGIYEFTGAMINSGLNSGRGERLGPKVGSLWWINGDGSGGDTEGNQDDADGESGGGDECNVGSSAAGDPVDTGTGLFIYNHCDIVLDDRLPIKLTRAYRVGDVMRPFGLGTSHPYEMYLCRRG